MYKLTKKDAGKLIFHTKGMIPIPCYQEGTPSDVTDRELYHFIERFNKKYSKDAEVRTEGGLEYIFINRDASDL
jgi:hypothetical protein